jgi:hypothetical protein
LFIIAKKKWPNSWIKTEKAQAPKKQRIKIVTYIINSKFKLLK